MKWYNGIFTKDKVATIGDVNEFKTVAFLSNLPIQTSPTESASQLPHIPDTPITTFTRGPAIDLDAMAELYGHERVYYNKVNYYYREKK